MKDDIIRNLEMVGVGMNFLRMAVEGNDPKAQVLLRINDEHKNIMDVLQRIRKLNVRDDSSN